MLDFFKKKPETFPKKQSESLYLKWKNWENVGQKWSQYASPFRLSHNDIENYKKSLRSLESERKVLILGSTPELRDICAEAELDVTVADFSLAMMENMFRFMKVGSKFKEKWIKADWLALDNFLKDGFFDVILGDMVLRNIEPERQNYFLEKIGNLLKPEGFFIGRAHFFNERLTELKAEEIIREIFKNYSNYDDKSLEDLIASRLFDRNTDFKTKKINKTSFFTDIKNLFRNAATGDKERYILKNISKKWGGQITWTQRTEKEIENFFSANNFQKVERKPARDYIDAGFYPVFVYRKVAK